MALIIDGYNLLNATGIAGGGTAGSSLAQSRAALLDFLAARLAAADRYTTTVVFDGRNAPPGLAPTFIHRGITVRFARPHREADDLIEELIRSDTSPRRLTVVSSDHRLHRAARRRRATPIDSEVWFRQFEKRPIQPVESVAVPDEAASQLASAELDEWLRIFSDATIRPESSSQPADRSVDESAPSGFENPFPPGYAEDLLRGDEP
ncbi:MAG: NYN domain-containing protein [Pirellulaceae bacterium]|nr:NYN domain-containing protein [Pirellulaceae bacterium]